MEDETTIARQFDEKRAHLRRVAHRMLGSEAEADDAVQEAWLKVARANTGAVANVGGWLTTVVARVCLDMLRARRARREDAIDTAPDATVTELVAPTDPELDVLVVDALGPALLVVLDTLAPAERLAFVLHDMFGVAFEEIAPIVGRSPLAARKLASRGRQRVQGKTDDDPPADTSRQREVVAAFLAASRSGDLDALLAVLDPDVVVRADATAVSLGAAAELRGRDAMIKQFAGRARGARAAQIDGVPSAMWAPGGKPKVVFDFTIANGRIVALDLVADRAVLATLDITDIEA